MNLNLLCQDVRILAKQVGQFLLQESKGFDVSRIEQKGLNDLVSYVDKEAEKQIVERLSVLLPHSGFIAEEGTGSENPTGYNWIIDPLDGTTNFIHGIPHYAVSIALQNEQKELVLGIVYEPNRDECFHAVLGGKAFLNDTEIRVSQAQELSRGLLATGFPYTDFGQMQEYLQSLQELMQKCHGLRRIGSAALDLAYVACGRFEGFFEYNLRPWDVAAGVLIVRQAGGIATTFRGTDDCVFGKQILAASQVHPEILEIVQKHFSADLATHGNG